MKAEPRARVSLESRDLEEREPVERDRDVRDLGRGDPEEWVDRVYTRIPGLVQDAARAERTVRRWTDREHEVGGRSTRPSSPMNTRAYAAQEVLAALEYDQVRAGDRGFDVRGSRELSLLVAAARTNLARELRREPPDVRREVLRLGRSGRDVTTVERLTHAIARVNPLAQRDEVITRVREVLRGRAAQNPRAFARPLEIAQERVDRMEMLREAREVWRAQERGMER